MGLLLMILASGRAGLLPHAPHQFLLLYRKQPRPPPDEAVRAADGFRFIKPVPGLPLREYLYGGGSTAGLRALLAGPEARPLPPRPPPRRRGDLLLPQRHHPVLVPGAGTPHWPAAGSPDQGGVRGAAADQTAGRLLERTEPAGGCSWARPCPSSRPSGSSGPWRPRPPGSPTAPREARTRHHPRGAGRRRWSAAGASTWPSTWTWSWQVRLPVRQALTGGGEAALRATRVPFTLVLLLRGGPADRLRGALPVQRRPLPQLTSFIVDQLKKIIKKRKHTLPSYKIR